MVIKNQGPLPHARPRIITMVARSPGRVIPIRKAPIGNIKLIGHDQLERGKTRVPVGLSGQGRGRAVGVDPPGEGGGEGEEEEEGEEAGHGVCVRASASFSFPFRTNAVKHQGGAAACVRYARVPLCIRVCGIMVL